MSDSEHDFLEAGASLKVAGEQLLIVGIGASAGGIAALKAFFAQVASDSGVAYVVIVHLSPEHKSHLAEVLQSSAAIPVSQVRGRVRVVGDHVYVIPPNQSLSMDDGHLTLSEITTSEQRRAPVDLFFRTLAETHRSRAICVVLSGMGADGSVGMKRVKEYGGLCIAQTPGEAAHSDMPRHAIATNLVDEVLPVAEIPAKILAYKGHRARLASQAEAQSGADDRAVRDVLAQLRTRTGHDFAPYKHVTVLRRIQRRVAFRELADLTEYAKYFRQHADEPNALLKDLLISVTNFFRDASAFEAVEREIIPRLFEKKGRGDFVRVWIPGCATGEEVYSIAMLLAEHAQTLAAAPHVQVFATDIDEAALTTARAGHYTLSGVADVTAERLLRFFIKEGEGYRVGRELREMVLFASHNLIKHPPYSHLDLVTCRNVLIYVNRPTQERIMDVFHFALNPGGYLFLGMSESIAGSANLFTAIDRDAHIFQRCPLASRPALAFSSPNITPMPSQPHAEAIQLENRARQRVSYQDLHQRLLEQYAPPSLIVNEAYKLVHVSERAGRYLQVPGGEPTDDVLKMVRSELRLELGAALYAATQKRMPMEVPDVPVQIDGVSERIDLIVRPALGEQGATQGFILVLFQPRAHSVPASQRLAGSAEPVTRHVDEELIRLRVQLSATIARDNLQQEVLTSSNEELQSMNEELRSASEELETGKEELQSFNEELSTVNEELKVKIDELTQARNDTLNLIHSTDTATVFLDRSMRVKLFTPRARGLFNLIPADSGRRLMDITHQLQYDSMMADVGGVLETLLPVEREVQSQDGKWFMARVLPYRTADDRIDGAVLTFTNISERKQAEEKLRVSEEQFRRAIEDAPIPVIMHAEDGEVLQISRTWSELTGYALHDVPTVQVWRNAAYGEGAEAVRDHMHELFRGSRKVLDAEFAFRTRDGAERHWSFNASSPGTLVDGRRFIVGMAVDITARKLAERALRASEDRYRMLFDSIDEGFCIVEMIFDASGKPVDYQFLEVNAAFEKQTGLRDVAGKRMRELAPDHEAHWFEMYGKVAATGESVRFENRAEALHRWFDVYASRVGGADSRRVNIVFTDITQRRLAEEALRRSEERLRLTLESVTEYAIMTMDTAGTIQSWNIGAERIFGYTEAEAVGQKGHIIFTAEDRERGAPELEMRTARENGAAADERWHLRKSGARFYVSGVLTAVRDGPLLVGYSKIAQDLTQRREAEAALRIAREELEVRVLERTRELAQANESLRLEFVERTQSEEMRVRLLGQLVHAQESERGRISRELHDQLGQQISALGLKLSALKGVSDLAAPVRKELETLESITKQLDSDVDFLVWELRPTALDDLGLLDALSDYVVSWSKHYAVHAQLHSSGMQEERLASDIETVLYRVTQEALNNVAKHAGANQVDVILERRFDHVSLIIEDDGVGFDPERLLGTGTKALGLVGMRERVAFAGGTVSIESATGDGTTVFVRIPAQQAFRGPGPEAGEAMPGSPPG